MKRGEFEEKVRQVTEAKEVERQKSLGGVATAAAVPQIIDQGGEKDAVDGGVSHKEIV